MSGRARRSALALALALVAALVALPPIGSDAPLGASAAHAATKTPLPRFSLPSGHLTSFELRGSHGYSVLVTANMLGRVTVEATKGRGRTEYVANGKPTRDFGARARFRGLGSVAFDFRPIGRPRKTPPYPGCKGRPTTQSGVIRGRVEFEAERGFTAVSARRARAELVRWPRLRCRLQLGGDSRGVGAQFFALAEGRGSVGFSATRYAPDARPRARRIQFEASAEERRRGVRILRSVAVAAGPPTFRQPEREHVPEHLVLTPPAPFSGSASFQRTPESTFTWTGPLRVEFPGTDPVALAGPDFTAAICALRGCAAKDLSALFGLF